jgi:two-component system, OmpR family, response regulator
MKEVNILIVEDVSITALEIKKSLMQMGYSVTDIASSYEDALQSIKRKKPDIILLDIDLKGEKNGIELAKTICKNDSIPFIYLTSDDNDDTMREASKTDPAAYLMKPFRREELKSNLMIVLNKIQQKNTLLPLSCEYYYDNKTKKIYHKRVPIYLSSNEKLFLQLLVESKGSLVPLNIIEEHLWGEDAPLAENSLRSLVYRLRTKLKDLPIETIPSFGYRLMIKD